MCHSARMDSTNSTPRRILISKRDAAIALSLSVRTIENLIARKELAARRVGRCRFVTRTIRSERSRIAVSSGGVRRNLRNAKRREANPGARRTQPRGKRGRKERIAMRSKTHLPVIHKGKPKSKYFRHPFSCTFSQRRMTAADCNQVRQPEASRAK